MSRTEDQIYLAAWNDTTDPEVNSDMEEQLKIILSLKEEQDHELRFLKHKKIRPKEKQKPSTEAADNTKGANKSIKSAKSANSNNTEKDAAASEVKKTTYIEFKQIDYRKLLKLPSKSQDRFVLLSE